MNSLYFSNRFLVLVEIWQYQFFDSKNSKNKSPRESYEGSRIIAFIRLPHSSTEKYLHRQSKVELCDILTDDHTYIHIKPYSGPATLSNLFSQAVISADLVMSDREFLIKANDKIKKESTDDRFLISTDYRPKIILAIISSHCDDRPPIPFFSKIALRYTKRRLQAYGCNVFIKNIQKTV